MIHEVSTQTYNTVLYPYYTVHDHTGEISKMGSCK